MAHRKIEFSKIEANGNDFIFIDGRIYPPEIFSDREIRRFCDRHLGIGADGMIFLAEDDEADFRMRFYNSDGFEGNMCANGSRAIAFMAHHLGIGNQHDLTFMARDGIHQVNFDPDGRLHLQVLLNNQPESVEDKIDLPAGMAVAGFVNTGVPHLVIELEKEFSLEELEKLGQSLRHHSLFEPVGTNVNFVTLREANKIDVVTYEKGVEALTLSCGTGVTGSVLVMNQHQMDKQDLWEISTRGGNLQVRLSAEDIYITGEVRIVFEGIYHMEL